MLEQRLLERDAELAEKRDGVFDNSEWSFYSQLVISHLSPISETISVEIPGS
jgi:hypothetical protein